MGRSQTPPLQQMAHALRQQNQILIVLPDGTKVTSSRTGGHLGTVEVSIDGRSVMSFVRTEATQLRGVVGTLPPQANIPLPILEVVPSGNRDSLSIRELWASLYALWITPGYSMEDNLFVTIQPARFANYQAIRDHLVLSGLGYTRPDLVRPETDLVLSRYAFWQGAGVPESSLKWVSNDVFEDPTFSNTYPYIPTQTNNGKVATAHPTRPPKPVPGSTIYKRYLPAIGEMLTFMALDMDDERHFEAFHKWHNDERVNEGWMEMGDRDRHWKYLEQLRDDPHVIPVVAAWNGNLFGYFEFTWVKEDTLSTYSGVTGNDWDRGYHVLVGEEAYRGIGRFLAWKVSLVHYLFLSDSRTQRLQMEPKAGSKIIGYCVDNLGFTFEREFNFPHKRSALMSFTRERFLQQALLLSV